MIKFIRQVATYNHKFSCLGVSPNQREYTNDKNLQYTWNKLIETKGSLTSNINHKPPTRYASLYKSLTRFKPSVDIYTQLVDTIQKIYYDIVFYTSFIWLSSNKDGEFCIDSDSYRWIKKSTPSLLLPKKGRRTRKALRQVSVSTHVYRKVKEVRNWYIHKTNTRYK